MTALLPDTDSLELEAFRAQAVGWLEANAERRVDDVDDLKRRVVAGSLTLDEERQLVKRSQAWQRRIYDAGFAGLAVPSEYGGRGLTAAHERIWRQELARFAIDLARIGLGSALAAPTILAHGTEEQKHRFIPPVLRGEVVWCQLFSEPGAGSDLAGLTTRAELDGDEWVLNGQKVWNSYAHLADWAILLARTNWDVPKHRGISFFLLDMSTTGVEPRPLRQITGEAHFNETFLTDVRIPGANLLGGLDNGWAVAQTTLMNERTMIGASSGNLGFADWVELARHYGRLGDPVIRQELAQLYTRAEVMRWLGLRVQAAARAGRGPGPESSVAKLFASVNMGRNANLAMTIEQAGAMLYANDAHDDGFWQQTFLGQWNMRIGGGTEQIQRNVIAERVLGLPAEPRPDKAAPFRELPRNG